MTTFNCVVATAILVLSSSALANAPAASTPAAAIAASTPNPVTSTPAPTAAVATAVLTDAEKKKLSAEFHKALSSQRIAFAHQERSAKKELKTSQAVKKKKWFETEKNARHDFFDKHMNGPERRQYVQDYMKKKQDMENSLKVEAATFKKTWAEKHQAMKQSQKELEAKFNASLSQGVRPTHELWPSGN